MGSLTILPILRALGVDPKAIIAFGGEVPALTPAEQGEWVKDPARKFFEELLRGVDVKQCSQHLDIDCFDERNGVVLEYFKKKDGQKILLIRCEKDVYPVMKEVVASQSIPRRARQGGFSKCQVIQGLRKTALGALPSDWAVVDVLIARSALSSLGCRLTVTGYSKEIGVRSTHMTVGGMILVDGKFYGLATGHGLARLRPTSARKQRGELKDGAGIMRLVLKERLRVFDSGPCLPQGVLRSPAYKVKEPERGPHHKGKESEGGPVGKGKEPERAQGPAQDGDDALGQPMPVSGRIIATKYPIQQRSEHGRYERSVDWALLEYREDDNGVPPPNSLFHMEPIDDVLWPEPVNGEETASPDQGCHRSTSFEGQVSTNFIHQVMSRADMDKLLLGQSGLCAVVTPRVIVPGFITAGTASVILDGAMFDALRVYTKDPIEDGDSGSWVLVNGRCCGVVFAAFDAQTSAASLDPEASHKPDSELGFPGAYVIRIQDVLDSIKEALSATTVRLPNKLDWQISTLRSRRRGPEWIDKEIFRDRYFEMELLLARQKSEALGDKAEEVRLEPTTAGASLTALSAPWHRSDGFSGKRLELLTGVRLETLGRLLLLGEVCPLAPVLRVGLKRWIQGYRKYRLENTRSFACSLILERCIHTQAGENLLGLLIVLWKFQRPETGRQDSGERERRIVWLAQLLSTLCEGMRGIIPTTAVPSLDQLQSFVHTIVAAFRDKDLKHLYLVQGTNQRTSREPANAASWALDGELHLSVWRRALRFRVPEVLSTANGALQRGRRRATGGATSGFGVTGAGGNDDTSRWEIRSVAEVLGETVMASEVWNHTVASTARLLILLHRLASTSDRATKAIVCGGSFSSLGGFYAAVVLDLEVEVRRRRYGPSTQPAYFPYREALENLASGQRPPSDVFVFPDGPDVCEIIDRSDWVTLPHANGHEAVAKPVAAEPGADKEAKDGDGRTPLHLAADVGNEAAVKLLLATGSVDIDSKDSHGRTPLLYAAGNGHEAVVKLLIEVGAEKEAKDNYGWTPLHRAALDGHEAVAKL
ncbi:hypothetical protein MAPG_10503, partial [Magnaporthiopsis poae ATCC 64411]